MRVRATASLLIVLVAQVALVRCMADLARGIAVTAACINGLTGSRLARGGEDSRCQGESGEDGEASVVGQGDVGSGKWNVQAKNGPRRRCRSRWAAARLQVVRGKGFVRCCTIEREGQEQGHQATHAQRSSTQRAGPGLAMTGSRDCCLL